MPRRFCGKYMFDNYVFLDQVNVFDDKVFTTDRAIDWMNHMLNSYADVLRELKIKIDTSVPISFYVNKSLVLEVLVDAIIGMRKITDSAIHPVQNPNAFKIAAYIGYWWLRHKPVSLHFPGRYFLEQVKIVDGEYQDAEYERQKTIWRLKHINELIAVQIVATYIFRFDRVFCKKRQCDRIKKLDDNFCFEDFEEMKTVILQKLTYYFAYRPLAPKIIEHILEGYTFHPAWGLTGPQWATGKTQDEH